MLKIQNTLQFCLLVFVSGCITSCMTQKAAPIEFKSTSSKSDVSKYYIEEEDNQVTSSAINEIPSQSAPVSYLVEDVDQKDSPHFSKDSENTGLIQEPTTDENKEEQKNVPQKSKIAEEPKDLDNELSAIFDKPVQKQQEALAPAASQTPEVVAAKPNKTLPEGLSSHFINPVDGKVVKVFDEKSQGINIAATLRDPVKSIYDGQVVYAGYDNKFGNLIIVKAKDSEFFIAFAHLDDLIINKGEQIAQGQVIGHVGQTGSVEEPQLYLAIKKGKVALDPLLYLDY
jgi:murein DD-endopeptidase MepM/ murein hydrolase activator NlpD